MNSEMPRGDDHFYFSRVTDVSGQESAHHYHESLEIYCLISGNCNYFIESTSYKVAPGDIVVIPGGTIHRTNYSSRTHSRLLINCPESLLPEALAKKLASIRGTYRNEDMLGEMISLFEKIEAEYAHPDDLSQGLITSYTVELLSLIARGENSNSDARRGYADKMIKYIQEN